MTTIPTNKIPAVLQVHSIRTIWTTWDHVLCSSFWVVADDTESVIIVKVSAIDVVVGEGMIIGVATTQLILHSVYECCIRLNAGNISAALSRVTVKTNVVRAAAGMTIVTVPGKPMIESYG